MPTSPGLPLRRLLPRVALPVAATCAAVLTALPAAASAVLPLHAAHRGTTAAAFGNHSCDQIPAANQGPGSDGFVFVLPSNDATFLTLTLTFRTTGNDEVIVAVPDPSDAYPDGITTNGTSKAWVVVPAGWTLLDGSATVDNTDTKADDFNLTHTCVGGVSSSPSPSPSPSGSPSTSPSASVSASVSASQTGSPSPGGSGTVEGSSPATATPPPGGGGSLPVTGVALTTMTLTAAGLIAGGVALLMVRRRRLTPIFVADDDPRPSPES